MTIRRSLAVGLGLALAAPLVAPGGAAAAPAPIPAVQSATTWLATQQQANGGFEVLGFPGFETSDVVLALAAGSQGGATWDRDAARAAVTAVTTGGKDALDEIDDLVDGAADPTSVAAAARAAKVVTLVANPLGLSPTDFDPSDDSASPVDLIARIELHEQPDGSYDLDNQFNGVLYVAAALAGSDLDVPAGLIAQIRAAQSANGSWDYSGLPTEDTADIDTTALALLVLSQAGLERTDPDIAAGVAFLQARQSTSGAWQGYAGDDPNSTAAVATALSALRVDVTAAPFRSPYPYLLAQQAADGHIASPNDGGFPPSTFATSQTVQALARQWFLVDEHELLVDGLAATLGSPAAGPSTAAREVASDALGPNASSKAARERAAKAVLTSSFGREAAAGDLFQTALGRPLDPSGRAYWSNKLVTISRPEMLSRITGSAEFYRNAGSNVPSFVDAVYQSVLGRAPDAAGRTYWINRLNAGVSVSQVARSLVASTEYRRNQVDVAYDRILGRDADAGGRSYWTTKLGTTRIEVLLASLAGSSEFYDRAQTFAS